MSGLGGFPEDELEPQEDMVFRLEPVDIPEGDEDPPMWSMDPLGMRDWFFEEE